MTKIVGIFIAARALLLTLQFVLMRSVAMQKTEGKGVGKRKRTWNYTRDRN